METSALPVVTKCTRDPIPVFQQGNNRVFHVNRDALMNAVILQRADHLQSRAVTDVGETRITMTAEITLRNFPFLRSVEHRAPRFEFVNARGRFQRVQLGHAPVVDVLAAAHRIGEMDFPIVAVVHIAHRRRHAAFSHDRVCLAEKGLAHESGTQATLFRLDGGAQSRAACTYDDHVEVVGLVLGHLRTAWGRRTRLMRRA